MIRLLLTLLLAATNAAAQVDGPVQAESGGLPVILTAPHGGLEDLPGCSERSPAGVRFVNRPDINTDRLTRAIADELRRLTGKSPYLVIARFHRKYIDANRRAEEAYGDPGCAAAYEAYHAAVRSHVAELRAKFPHAMLFDIHGQTVFRDAILRGTRYGSTVQALLARAGAPAITGPDSVFGRFAAMGYAILPGNNAAPTERIEAKNYAGGHTVDLYGSHREQGIDAMQLEFGRDLRNGPRLEQTAKDSAQAIAAFYERFLR
ncbi:MAG: N-formylglutamate amidohydrolase [Burkholderiales bacterium]|nr:N-formylglutamate amidohydrolase [Burkholderiales bacterium]